ncbi:MAG: outer membrane beta-barrel protein [Flavobacteriales bacterium]|nr:outer membrane beta-barrel protein [Flavobacteriales bacterium]
MFRNLVLLCSLICGLSLQAQVSEVGITGGVSYYIGDINPTRHYPKDTKLAFGLLYRYNFTDRYAIRLQALSGTLQSYDSHSTDSLQLLRNLGFRARLLELSGLVEVNFRKYRSRDKDSKKWTPFIFAGLAYFRAAPQAQVDDTWYDLQPLGTEGQGTSARPGTDVYNVDNICIPFGAGFKVNVGRLDFQLEWGLRRTYTDYIDDVSSTYVDRDLLAFENGPLAAALADPSVLAQLEEYPNEGRARGDMNTRDWYQYTGLSVTYIISRFSDCEEQYNWMRKRR